jgi:GNAT superfamily N-acetyltransferase
VIKVRQVESKQDRKKFVELPFKLYKDNQYWVPPLKSDIYFKLDTKKHPFWEHAIRELFIAEEDGKVVGRIAAIVDFNYNELWQENMGAFGFFESVIDDEVAVDLLDAAIMWLKEQGAEFVRGPLSPSMNDECGFLIEGYNSPPVFMMPYNLQYYPELVERYGFRKAKDLLAFYKSHEDPPSPQVMSVVEHLLQNPNITLRTLDMKHLDRDIKIIKELYNASWEDNWGFSPMTEKEFNLMVRELKKIVDPQLVWFAYYKGQPAGISITLPDYNFIFKKLNGRLGPIGILKFLYYSKRIPGTRALIFGFKKEYRRLGLPSLLYYKTEQAALKHGYKWCELSWNLEDNDLINQFDTKVGGRVYKRYRIYEKPIK